MRGQPEPIRRRLVLLTLQAHALVWAFSLTGAYVDVSLALLQPVQTHFDCNELCVAEMQRAYLSPVEWMQEREQGLVHVKHRVWRPFAAGKAEERLVKEGQRLWYAASLPCLSAFTAVMALMCLSVSAERAMLAKVSSCFASGLSSQCAYDRKRTVLDAGFTCPFTKNEHSQTVSLVHRCNPLPTFSRGIEMRCPHTDVFEAVIPLLVDD